MLSVDKAISALHVREVTISLEIPALLATYPSVSCATPHSVFLVTQVTTSTMLQVVSVAAPLLLPVYSATQLTASVALLDITWHQDPVSPVLTMAVNYVLRITLRSVCTATQATTS